MSSAQQILAMLRSRAEGDDEQFFSIALQVAASEARQGRRQIALELRDAVDAARNVSKGRVGVAIPFAQQRGDLDGLLQMRATRLSLADVVLADDVKVSLGNVVQQQRRRDWLREHGKTPSRRLLFVGPPGSGKTMTAEALSGELKLPLFVIRLEALITRFLGETAAKLRLVFDDTARRRGVYLFDEFDAVGGKRLAANDVGEMRRVLNSFLQFMEEPNASDSLIVGATNHAELLDRALLRRFDSVIQFRLPTAPEIKQIVQANLGRLKYRGINWSRVTAAARGLSQSEISRATEDAAKNAILGEQEHVTTLDLVARLQDRSRMRTAFGGPPS